MWERITQQSLIFFGNPVSPKNGSLFFPIFSFLSYALTRALWRQHVFSFTNIPLQDPSRGTVGGSSDAFKNES